MRTIFVAFVCLAAVYGQHVTDTELRVESSWLFDNDVNNQRSLVKVDFSRVHSVASRFLTVIAFDWAKLRTIRTYRTLLDLFSNPCGGQDLFMTAIMNTQVMKDVMNFLVTKGYFHDMATAKKSVEELWFDKFQKQGIPTCGFQHVFMGDISNGQVTGLHNWVYFANQEDAGNAKRFQLLDDVRLKASTGVKAAIVKIDLTYMGIRKMAPTTMLVGTSPEMEIALFTLCFYARKNANCPVKLAGKSKLVWTHSVDGHPTLLASAFVRF